MREHTQLSFEFKMISGKKVTADFSGGEVTSDAGALVLHEVCGRTGKLITSILRPGKRPGVKQTPGDCKAGGAAHPGESAGHNRVRRRPVRYYSTQSFESGGRSP